MMDTQIFYCKRSVKVALLNTFQTSGNYCSGQMLQSFQLFLVSVFCSRKDNGTPLAIYEEYTKDSCGIKFAYQTSRSYDSPETVCQPFLCQNNKKRQIGRGGGRKGNRT